MDIMGTLALDAVDKTLGGLASVRDNRDKQATKGAFKKEAEFAATLAKTLKSPLIEGYSPGGFLRDALAGEENSRAVKTAADSIFRASSAGSRQNAKSRETLSRGESAELLGRISSSEAAGLEADEALSRFALSALGAETLKTRQNPFSDTRKGIEDWSG
ncbi:hypothetical protein FDZ71_03290, partial [bacterium]